MNKNLFLAVLGISLIFATPAPAAVCNPKSTQELQSLLVQQGTFRQQWQYGGYSGPVQFRVSRSAGNYFITVRDSGEDGILSKKSWTYPVRISGKHDLRFDSKYSKWSLRLTHSCELNGTQRKKGMRIAIL